MEHLKKIFFVALTLFFLGGCSHSSCVKSIPDKAKAQKPPATQAMAQPCLDNIEISGNISAVIKEGRTNNIYIVNYARNKDDKQLNPVASTLNGKIYITAPKSAKEPINIEITVPKIISLTVRDGAYIRTPHIYVRNLSVIASSNMPITLNGKIFTKKTYIQQNGKNKISIGWLDSDETVIEGKNCGAIWLAGVTRKMAANLSDAIHLDAKHMLSDIIDIKTNNYARADLFPIDKLTATTADNSIIFHYNYPKLININSKNYSNVLYIRSSK